MAEASKAREIGEDADIDESLMTSPIAASQFSMRQSPSDYFGSKAPEMGSLSGNRVIKRVSFPKKSINVDFNFSFSLDFDFVNSLLDVDLSLLPYLMLDVQPRFYSPNECIPFTPRRRTSRRREIVSPHPLLTSLLRPTDTPVRPSMSELDRYADR